jgi:predicted secreted hydrolase
LLVCLSLATIAAASHAASQLRLGSVLGRDAAADFERAEERREFRFPEDHGPHPRYRSEWWYLTASLESAGGDAYGVQFTLFRQALRAEPVIGGPWDASQIYLAHLALTDVGAGRHLEAERLSRGHPRLAGVAAAPFRAHLEGWELAAPGPGLTGLGLDGDTEAFAVRLRLDPEKPIVLQGDRGLSAKGPGQASYYYSLPRLAAAGEVRIGDDVVAVRGTAWLDREWSTSVLGDDQTGWDWFALQLESGDDLMMFQLRNRRGVRDPWDQGVWVEPGGDSHQLRTQDFTLEPLRYWKDTEGTEWPVAWRISVLGPRGPRLLEIHAAVDDQRMDTLLTYWEGMVRVQDESGRRIGTGYMELTGYE